MKEEFVQYIGVDNLSLLVKKFIDIHNLQEVPKVRQQVQLCIV